MSAPIKINFLHVLSAASIIPFLAPFALAKWADFPLHSAIELCGISATGIGALWIAAGVYISQRELQNLTLGSRKIAIANLKAAIANASRHVKLGATYTTIGMIMLILRVIFERALK